MFPTPKIPTKSTRKLLLPMKGKGMISTTLVKSERLYLVWAGVNYQPKAQYVEWMECGQRNTFSLYSCPTLWLAMY